MTKIIKPEAVVTYRDVEIGYNEEKNRWEFTLRNKERYAVSLKGAKETIDTPIKEPKKAFKRFEAYVERYNEIPEKVTVTGIAAAGSRYDTSTSVWTSDEKGNRAKTHSRNLIAITPENEAKLVRIREIKDELNKLHLETTNLSDSLTRAKLRGEDYD
jgi:hypothetical protein